MRARTDYNKSRWAVYDHLITDFFLKNPEHLEKPSYWKIAKAILSPDAENNDIDLFRMYIKRNVIRLTKASPNQKIQTEMLVHNTESTPGLGFFQRIWKQVQRLW